LRVVGLKSVEEVLAVITTETDNWQAQMLERIEKKVEATNE
jgi:phosphoribosylaminoimidazole carboxylase (NCAIR synthetase)